MYLREFHIKNFRNIKDLTIHFNNGVNIIIGENNSGKTTIFDALRICLGYGDRYRDIYVNKSDFHIDSSDPGLSLPQVEFDLIFEIEKDIETGWFRDLLVQKNDGTQELQVHHRYYYETVNEKEKFRYKIWGGENEGQQIEPDILDLLKHVYLGALRDAVQELKPLRGNKLGELYSNLKYDKQGNAITDEKREEMAGRIKTALHNDTDWTDLIDMGLDKVNEHLNETSIKGKEQKVGIDFLPFEFRRLVDYLRMQIPIFEETTLQNNGSVQQYFDLFQNGLGYNNLIYTATVLGDLKVIKEVDPETYIALIIEEPEAHLHPQLQNIFFNYMSELNNEGFQVFISSHSPTLTATADLDSLIILQNQSDSVNAFTLRDSNLEESNKKYLSKFLDVTKSQLFFANGVILVEGISEALLLQLFSEILDKNGKYNLEKNGIEIVNVNGVAFEHFAKLFNSDDATKRLNCKCSILTDNDKHKYDGEISSRAQKAMTYKGENLEVLLAENTFEYELVIANKDILFETFSRIHPTAAGRIDQRESIEEFGKNFVEKVESDRAKSELSHTLAIRLENEPETKENFEVPVYIQQAIKWCLE
ncbi:MAG TPA: AAA family ATPase [Bacteroidales bacterium]|nr:AAA family ATPase [Bacteroidales bacterium]